MSINRAPDDDDDAQDEQELIAMYRELLPDARAAVVLLMRTILETRRKAGQ